MLPFIVYVGRSMEVEYKINPQNDYRGSLLGLFHKDVIRRNVRPDWWDLRDRGSLV